MHAARAMEASLAASRSRFIGGATKLGQENATAQAEQTTTTVKAMPTTAFFQPNVCSMINPPEITVLLTRALGENSLTPIAWTSWIPQASRPGH